MPSVAVRHKHVRLNQDKLNRVKAILGSASETEALDGAMNLILAEEEIRKSLRRVKGKARIRRLFA